MPPVPGARKRLKREECRKIFSGFRDAKSRTLQRNLDGWRISPADYIPLIPFVDGDALPIGLPTAFRRCSRARA
jgi:hypothetical protein